MKAFKYYNAQDLKDAVAVLSKPGDSRVLAGGTDILGDMKTRNTSPERLVNLKSIQGLDSISAGSAGLKLGALARLGDIAANATVKAKYTGLAEAAESVGSPQLRNMGTLGGNLCQRPRCWYYRGPEYNCVRKGGGICYAVSGRNKYHCILNGGPCFIVHPSDVAPMLMALGASVTIASAKGTREVKLDDFFVLPETDPTVETVLAKGEVLTGVTVPAPAAGQKSHYLKFKERESRDFTLVGAAVVLDMAGHTVRKASLVLSGVSPAPYRAVEAEKVLSGKELTGGLLEQAAEAALKDAAALEENEYKIQLAKTILKRAVLRTAGVEV